MKRFLTLLLMLSMFIALSAPASALGSAQALLNEYAANAKHTSIPIEPKEGTNSVKVFQYPGEGNIFGRTLSAEELSRCEVQSIGKINDYGDHDKYYYRIWGESLTNNYVNIKIGFVEADSVDQFYDPKPADCLEMYDYNRDAGLCFAYDYTLAGRLHIEDSLKIYKIEAKIIDLKTETVVDSTPPLYVDRLTGRTWYDLDKDFDISSRLDFSKLNNDTTYLFRIFLTLIDPFHYYLQLGSSGRYIGFCTTYEFYRMYSQEFKMVDTLPIVENYAGPSNGDNLIEGTDVSLGGVIKTGNGPYLTAAGAYVFKDDETWKNARNFSTLPDEPETGGMTAFAESDKRTVYDISALNDKCNFAVLSPGSHIYAVFARTNQGLHILREIHFTVEKKTPETYKILYYSEPGVKFREQTKTEGKTLTLLTAKPTKAYYSVIGWDTDSSAAVVRYTPGQKYKTDKELTLYAVWIPKTYTLHYDAQDGTGAPPDQTAEAESSFVISDTVPQRYGYHFTGWSSDTGSYQPGDRITLAENQQSITLRANWELNVYSVVFQPNGGVGKVKTLSKVHDNDKLTGVGSKWMFYKPNCRFVGWAYSPNATRAEVVVQPNAQYRENADATLYAVWEEADSFTWTLCYTQDTDNFNRPLLGYESFNGSEKRSESTDTARTVQQDFTTREKGRLAGDIVWSTAPNAAAAGNFWDIRLWLPEGAYRSDNPHPAGFYTIMDEEAVEVTTSTLVDHDMLVYPYWQFDSWALYFDANGGSGEPIPIIAKTGESIRIPDVVLPRRGDLVFRGWAMESDAMQPVNYASYGSFRDETLYAVWRDKFERDQKLFANAAGGETTVYAEDGKATLKVIASSTDGAVRYEWYKGYSSGYGAPWIPDERGDTLNLSGLTQSGAYVCKVMDNHSTMDVRFYVVCENLSIATKSSADYYAAYNSTPTLMVDASVKEGDIHYQWSKDYSALEGETGSTLTLEPVTGRARYECRVTDDFGSSKTVDFTVYVENGFRVEPDGYDTIFVEPGESLTLTVDASCTTGELTYQWNGSSVSSGDLELTETSNALVTDPISEERFYTCTVTDQYGNSKDASFNIRVRGEKEGIQSWVDHTETVTVAPNESATLRALIPRYEGELTYSWWTAYRYPNGYVALDEEIPGAATDSLTTEPITNAKSYYCSVEDAFGNYQQFYFHVVVDNGLTVAQTEPVVINHVCNVELSVDASCINGSLRYQWYTPEGVPITGANTARYIAENVADTITYQCKVTDEYDNCVTASFDVIWEHDFQVERLGSAYRFVRPGESATLQISASCPDDTLHYRWYVKTLSDHDEYSASGVMSDTYVFDDGFTGVYACHVTDSYGNTKVVEFTVFDEGVERDLDEGLTQTVSITNFQECAALYFTPAESGEYTFSTDSALGSASYLFDGERLIASANAEESAEEDAEITAALASGIPYTLLVKHVYEGSGRIAVSVCAQNDGRLHFSDQTLSWLGKWKTGPVYRLEDEFLMDLSDSGCLLTLSDGSEITEASLSLISGDEGFAGMFRLSSSDEGFVLTPGSFGLAGTATFRLTAQSETGSTDRAFTVTVDEIPQNLFPTQARTRVAVKSGEAYTLNLLEILSDPVEVPTVFRYVLPDSSAETHVYQDIDSERFTLEWEDSENAAGGQIFTAYDPGSYNMAFDAKYGVNLVRTFLFEIRVIPENRILTLPASLSIIEEDAFMGVSAELVILPDSCRLVSEGAFRACPNLIEISVPSGCVLYDGALDPGVVIKYR